jgi:hypothetical protein
VNTNKLKGNLEAGHNSNYSTGYSIGTLQGRKKNPNIAENLTFSRVLPKIAKS